MGNVMPSLTLANGFSLFGGFLYLPDRDFYPLTDTDNLVVSYAHMVPGVNFEWIGMRAHLVDGLTADRYLRLEPWQSDPWNGGQGGGTTAGTISLTDFGLNSHLHGIAGMSDDDTDSVTFDNGASLSSEPEAFTWDVPDAGHIGYLFHDFGTSPEAGNIDVTWSSGLGPEKAAGSVRAMYASSVTVGAVVVEDDAAGTYRVGGTLPSFMDEGQGLLIVAAAKGPPGFQPSDAHYRPMIEISTRRPPDNLIPKYKAGQWLFPVSHEIGFMGQPGGTFDGGGP